MASTTAVYMDLHDDPPPPFPPRLSGEETFPPASPPSSSVDRNKSSSSFFLGPWSSLHPESKVPHVFEYDPSDFPHGIFVHAASTSRYIVASSILIKSSEKPSPKGKIEIQIDSRTETPIVPVIDTRHPGVFGVLLDSDLLNVPTTVERPGDFGKVMGGFLGFLARAFSFGSATDVKALVTLTLPASTAPRQRFLTLEASNGTISVDETHGRLAHNSAQLPDSVFLRTTNGSVTFGGAPHPLEEVTLETSNANISAYELEALEFAGDGPPIPTRATFSSSNGNIRISNVTSFGTLTVDTSNAKIDVENGSGSLVNLKTSNGSISLSDLRASELHANTSNAKIMVERLHAQDDVSLTTSNSDIRVLEMEVQRGTLRVRTSNSKVKIENANVGGDMFVDTSNADVKVFRSLFHGKKMKIKTSNSRIVVGERGVPFVMPIAPPNAFVSDGSGPGSSTFEKAGSKAAGPYGGSINNSTSSSSSDGFPEPVKVHLKTSNGSLSFFVSNFEGHFSCTTSSSKAEVVSENAAPVVLTRDEKNSKAGTVGSGSAAVPGAEITMETSSSKCLLSFE